MTNCQATNSLRQIVRGEFSSHRMKRLLCEKKHIDTFLELPVDMSQFHIRSMDNLPVEIFHQIFDHLDIETIFFSIRHVCADYFDQSSGTTIDLIFM